MSSQYTKKILIGFSFLLITWGIVGIALSESGIGLIDSSAKSLSINVQDNQAVLPIDYTIAVVSSGTINVTLDMAVWSGIGTLNCCSQWATKSLDVSLLALIIGTISIERVKDKRLLKLRDRIADEISANPGVHLRELHRSIGCAMGALQYHLKNLEDDGIITSLRAGNVRHFFPQGYADDERVLLLTALARNPTVGAILTECLNNGQTTQAEISRTLNVDKSLISYYTSSLLDADILRTVKVFGREKPVILTDWARSSMNCASILVQ